MSSSNLKSGLKRRWRRAELPQLRLEHRVCSEPLESAREFFQRLLVSLHLVRKAGSVQKRIGPTDVVDAEHTGEHVHELLAANAALIECSCELLHERNMRGEHQLGVQVFVALHDPLADLSPAHGHLVDDERDDVAVLPDLRTLALPL